MSTKTHAKTINDLASALDLSTRQTAHYRSRDGFPKKTAQGWPIDEVAAYITAQKKAQADHAGRGPLADSKRKKIELECELLQFKIDEARERLEPKRNRQEALLLYCSIVRQTLEQLPRDLAEISQNPAMRKIAQDKCDALLGSLDDACRDAGRLRCGKCGSTELVESREG